MGRFGSQIWSAAILAVLMAYAGGCKDGAAPATDTRLPAEDAWTPDRAPPDLATPDVTSLAPDLSADLPPVAWDAVGDGSLGSASVAGSIKGSSFNSAASAIWIGKPDAGSLPVRVFVSDAVLSCAAVSSAGWDKLLGTNQLLELGVAGTTLKAYKVGTDADANYLKGSLNPDAGSGSITLTAVSSTKIIQGTFDLGFGIDTLKGSFKAVYCAGGVEP